MRRQGKNFPVVPGHRAAMNLESMNTDIEKEVSTSPTTLDRAVFMGSGFGLEGRPGTTTETSSQNRVCQTVLAYSPIARSAENQPMPAMLRAQAAAQASGSRHSASAARWARQ